MMIVNGCPYFVVETTPLNQGTGSIFMNQSSMNDESSIFNPLSFPLDCQRTNCGSFVLVERCICVCDS